MTREEKLEHKRKYYIEHREEILAKAKKRRQNRTPEQIERDKEYNTKWKRENREKRRAYDQKYKDKHNNIVYTYFELDNPELFDGTYNGCSEFPDCLTCPKEKCVFD